MYKSKKKTALFLAFIMILTFAVNPISAVYGSAPTIVPKLPIGKTPENPKESGVKTPMTESPSAPSLPTIAPKLPETTIPRKPAKPLEQPARAQGVNYEIRENVRKLPQGVQYSLDTLTLDRLATFEEEEGSPQTAQNANEEPFDKINGIRYPAGSKLLTVFNSAAVSFYPLKGEIYIDEDEGNAFRILGDEGDDQQGNELYAVETPDLLEVFKSYSIPKQTINLTTGNIAYIDPDFELSPESGMQKNYLARADEGIPVYENDYIKCFMEGNKHVLRLKSNVIIFQYPPKEEVEEKEREKKEAEKRKFEGDWWEKEQYSDLRGVENESAMSVTVKVKEGSKITVENPCLNTEFDINWLTTQMDATFSFIGKATADVTLIGDMTFKYSLEKCVYGYDIDLGKVAGKEKGNKAFVGIFLVLGIDGKIHVEVRTITTGDAEAGFTYRSVGFGSLPYYVGPISNFKPASFDMSFTVDGEINTTLACVPQVGVIVWGCELGVLQVWVGFKSTARFHFEGGGGSDKEGSLSGNGSIDLRAFGELVGYLLGKRYSIFYLEYPLFKGEWKIGEEVSGSGGDAVRKVLPFVKVDADAYANKVEGKIAFSTAGKTVAGHIGDDADMGAFQPYYNSSFKLEVYNKDKVLKFYRDFETDHDGKFSVRFYGAEDIFPSDEVVINIEDFMSPIFTIEDGRNFKVVGRSAEIKPTVPFSLMDFDVDTFNDVISGWVSGDYTGTISISIDKFVNNNRVTDIRTANVQGGLFKLDYPIDQTTDWVKVYIDFEGSKYGAGPKLRNLDALVINTFNYYADSPSSSSTGFSTTLPGGIGAGPSLPGSLQQSQDSFDDLSSRDIAGNRIIKPEEIKGMITNRGEMGYLTKQGDDYVRTGTSSNNLNCFTGNVKITAIPVQSALEVMLQKYNKNKTIYDHDIIQTQSGGAAPSPQAAFTATTQARQETGFRKVQDNNNPLGFIMQSYPTSAAKFKFNNPDVVAYKIEIEHEGMIAEHVYNPFVYHYESSSRYSMSDFIGPLRESYRLRTQERAESISNPVDTQRGIGSDIMNDIQRQMNQQQMR